MSLLFLVILTLFLPSCAGANLRKLGATSALVSFKLPSLGAEQLSLDAYKNEAVLLADFSSLEKLKAEAAQTHKSLEFLLKGEKKSLILPPFTERIKPYFKMGLSEDGLLRLASLEAERGRRWDKGQILHKQSQKSMSLQRTKEEESMIKNAAPLLHSSVGRTEQLFTENGEKVMSFCIILRRKNGGPLVGPRHGEKGLWFAEKEEVEMVVLSSSNQAKSNWITVKGGRNKGETEKQAALRETLEESGNAVTIRSRLDDMAVSKPKDDKDLSKGEDKSLWETWVMDAGEGAGQQYDKYSEDGRLRGWLAFDDAVTLIKHSDHKMAENVERVTALFGTQQTEKNAKLAETKLANDEPKN